MCGWEGGGCADAVEEEDLVLGGNEEDASARSWLSDLLRGFGGHVLFLEVRSGRRHDDWSTPSNLSIRTQTPAQS